MKIRKNDTILMIAGKDKGKKGKVILAIPQNQKIVVEGLNVVKKHSRPKKQGEKGQRILVPMALHISNVKLLCSKCGKATRVGYKLVQDKKFRICKKCKQEI